MPMKKSELYPHPPPGVGISEDEWGRLPLRSRMLISAGFADVDEVMEGWRVLWKKQGGK